MSLHAPPATSQTGVDRTIEHDDRMREYRLYVPPDLDRLKPAPLVFALHGGASKGVWLEEGVAYNEYAKRDGWIMVYPSGVDGHWNDLRAWRAGSVDPRVSSLFLVTARMSTTWG